MYRRKIEKEIYTMQFHNLIEYVVNVAKRSLFVEIVNPLIR